MYPCMHECMKTITLTDDAYERLLSWKQSPKDSFSSVVIRLVPPRGTLGQLIEDVRQLPPLSSKQFKAMEDAAAWGRKPDAGKDKWNT